MKSDALAALPHGPEFRFIDALTALDPGKSGTGTYALKSDAEFLKGHFPGQPIMPGVLMVEAIAQLAGIVFQSAIPEADRLSLLLTAVRGAKIRGTTTPGQTIQIAVEIVGQLGNLVQAKGRVTAGDIEIAEAQITLSSS
jgi:3-hydroxyacyl-[acyl-carrier-protein] dehydratase